MPQPPTRSLVLSAMQPWQQQTSLHPAAYEAHLPCKKGRLFWAGSPWSFLTLNRLKCFFAGIKTEKKCLTFSSHLYSLNLHHQLTTVGKSSNPHFHRGKPDCAGCSLLRFNLQRIVSGHLQLHLSLIQNLLGTRKQFTPNTSRDWFSNVPYSHGSINLGCQKTSVRKSHAKTGNHQLWGGWEDVSWSQISYLVGLLSMSGYYLQQESSGIAVICLKIYKGRSFPKTR